MRRTVSCTTRSLPHAFHVSLVMVYDSCGFFFFQAEDGIRDYKVTGVQTCALPISAGGGGIGMAKVGEAGQLAAAFTAAKRRAEAAFGNGAVYVERYLTTPRHIEEIGRASCRERV